MISSVTWVVSDTLLARSLNIWGLALWSQCMAHYPAIGHSRTCFVPAWVHCIVGLPVRGTPPFPACDGQTHQCRCTKPASTKCAKNMWDVGADATCQSIRKRREEALAGQVHEITPSTAISDCHGSVDGISAANVTSSFLHYVEMCVGP